MVYFIFDNTISSYIIIMESIFWRVGGGWRAGERVIKKTLARE